MISTFIHDREKRIDAGNKIYFIYFLLMISARALGMYEGTLIYTVVLVTAMLLFGAKMIISPHTLKEYLIAAALMLVAGIVYLHTGEKGLIVCFATLLGMKYVDKNRLLKYGTAAAGICIAARIFLGVFGITNEKYYLQYRAGAGTMLRHALGYAHPNTLHMNVLMLTMLIAYIVTQGLRKAPKKTGAAVLAGLSVLLTCMNLYVFQYSGSRTGVLVSVVFLLINIWFYLEDDPGLIQKIICYAAFPAVCILAIVVPLILPDDLYELLDRYIFNSRFMIARYFWSHNGISIWGIRLNKPDPQFETYGLDMAHLYLFLQLGIVAFLVIAVITMAYIHFALKKKRMGELAVMMGTLVAGIWEPYLYNLGFKNFTYVFMGALLYELVSAGEGYVSSSGDESDRDSIVLNPRSVKRIAISMGAGIIAGVLAALIFLAVTRTPSYLYADNAKNEAGINPGIEEVFLSADEISQIKADGNIVIGYENESTPMYKYDTETAVSEYHKKALSVGVWCAIFISLTVLLILFRKPGSEHENV